VMAEKADQRCSTSLLAQCGHSISTPRNRRGKELYRRVSCSRGI